MFCVIMLFKTYFDVIINCIIEGAQANYNCWNLVNFSVDALAHDAEESGSVLEREREREREK